MCGNGFVDFSVFGKELGKQPCSVFGFDAAVELGVKVPRKRNIAEGFSFDSLYSEVSLGFM